MGNSLCYFFFPPPPPPQLIFNGWTHLIWLIYPNHGYTKQEMVLLIKYKMHLLKLTEYLNNHRLIFNFCKIIKTNLILFIYVPWKYMPVSFLCVLIALINDFVKLMTFYCLYKHVKINYVFFLFTHFSTRKRSYDIVIWRKDYRLIRLLSNHSSSVIIM